MVEFNIHYKIINKYDNPVKKAYFELLVIPCRNNSQSVIEQNIQCKPDVSKHITINNYGFEAINFYLSKPFVELHFEYTATVHKNTINPYNFLSYSKKEEQRILTDFDFYLRHHLFLTATPLTSLPISDQAIFPAFKPSLQVFDYLLSLNEFVSSFMTYTPETTTTETTIADVLKMQKGVCQDYSHLLIAICRTNKIPARYVSGYLNQGGGLQGASQLHAWVEIFMPGLGWMGFDPTNNLLVNENYIKIAHGTDYNDCSTIKGVLENTGVQKSSHSVLVTNQ